MKVFKVLHKLEKPKITRFQQYLNSPYFNRRKDVILLLEAWLGGNRKRQRPEAYWSAIYDLETFEKSKWHLLTSRLFKLLESFLITEELQEHPATRQFYLVKAYRKLQEEQLFEKAVADTGKALEKQAFRNMNYWQYQHNLSYEKYDYIISANRKVKSNLQEVTEYFDTYFLSTKLRQACYALSRSIIKQESYNIRLVDEAIEEVERNFTHLKVPAIAVYYYCYKAISTEENEPYFKQLREAMEKYQQFFPPSEMRDIYTVAINYSIRKLNTGNPIFIKEAFELYQLSLAQGYLFEDGIMLESTYVNIVMLASKLKKYDWAVSFITDQQSHLKEAVRDSLYRFSLGKIYYEKGLLEKSLKELVLVDTKASFIFLGARVLQLKIYYELDEIDPLESLLESLRVYLQRSKDLAYRKAHYSNILSFTKRLLQLPAMSKKEKLAFQEQVEETVVLGEKEWFLRQIGGK
ncbi:MAG: hypothetical protein AB8F74_13655 [Saprospiraceae bacterium]